MGAFPRVRVVGLVEAGTHAIVDAAQGPYATGEQTLARGLAREGGRLGPGVLLLADRLLTGAGLWQAMAATGADLAWRVRCGGTTAPKLPVERVLADGSWLSHLRAAHGQRVTVRVIEYALSDPGRRTSTGRYRLVTTICDPTAAPAGELAALYTQRWEVETALAELKTTQRGPRQVLRSKSPTWSPRRSGRTRWSTTPCGRWCTPPPLPRTWTPTGCRLSAPCESSAAR